MARVQKTAVQLNNQNLVRKKKTLGDGFKTLPYVVSETDLGRNHSQPKFIKTLVYPPDRDPNDVLQHATGDVKYGLRMTQEELWYLHCKLINL